MNGSTAIELIDTYYWEIMGDYCAEKDFSELPDEQEAEKISKTDEFNNYAIKWISEL